MWSRSTNAENGPDVQFCKLDFVDSRSTLLPLMLAILAGCTSLLPSASNVTPTTFESFDAVRTAFEKVIPHRTTLAELEALGFDPQASANVTLIPYPEVVGRLVPYPGIATSDLNPGVRECIAAQTACRAFVFHFGNEHRKREGGFWLDFLNIRRVTNITGWRFEGFVVLNDNMVLFRNFAGEPRIERTEKLTNPLGPFQPAGETAGRSLLN